LRLRACPALSRAGVEDATMYGDKGIVELGLEGAVSVAVDDIEGFGVGDGHVFRRRVCGVVEVERTVFEVELVDDFRTGAVLGDDTQPNVGELSYKGTGNAASAVGVIEPWDEVPKNGGAEQGGMEGGERVHGCVGSRRYGLRTWLLSVRWKIGWVLRIRGRKTS
jgi:hypothetical protein